MHHLTFRNFIYALQFTTLVLPRRSKADEFTTTECHCFGMYETIPDNHGILSLTYYHDASKTTGHIDVPCPKGGCKPRKKSELAFCGIPQKEHGASPNEAAFQGAEGLCYKSTRDGGKKTVEQIVFPLGDGAGQSLVERGDENEIEGDDYVDDDIDFITDDEDPDQVNYQDLDIFEGEEEEEEEEDDDDDDEQGEDEPPVITTLSTTNSSTPSNDTTTGNTTTPTWQTLTNKTSHKLNRRSVCVDICWRYYTQPAMPDCGRWMLPGMGGPRGLGQKRSFWKNKCKKTAWRKVVNVDLGTGLREGGGDLNVTADVVDA